MFDVSYHVGKVVFSNLFVDLFVVGIVCVNGAVPGAMWLGNIFRRDSEIAPMLRFDICSPSISPQAILRYFESNMVCSSRDTHIFDRHHWATSPWTTSGL